MAEDADDADENWIERNSKTISTLATVSIPIVIAIFGYSPTGRCNRTSSTRAMWCLRSTR